MSQLSHERSSELTLTTTQKYLNFGQKAIYSPRVIPSIAKVLARIFLCVLSHALEHFKHLI